MSKDDESEMELEAKARALATKMGYKAGESRESATARTKDFFARSSGQSSAGQALKSALGKAGSAVRRAGKASAPHITKATRSVGKSLWKMTTQPPAKKRRTTSYGTKKRSSSRSGTTINVNIGGATSRTRNKRSKKRKSGDMGGFDMARW